MHLTDLLDSMKKKIDISDATRLTLSDM